MLSTLPQLDDNGRSAPYNQLLVLLFCEYSLGLARAEGGKQNMYSTGLNRTASCAAVAKRGGLPEAGGLHHQLDC